MSISGLLKGVTARLRSEEVLNDLPDQAVGKFVGIQPYPGKPPRGFGQWYASVRWGGGQVRDKLPERHDVYHGVIVTLTARLNYAPRDRQGIVLTSADDVYDLVDLIAGVNIIHGSWDVVNLANSFIQGTAAYNALHPDVPITKNGYTETLVLGPMGPERDAPADWVSEQPSKDVFLIDIRFADARRIQVQY